MKLNYFMFAAAMATYLGASAQFTNGGGSFSASRDYESSYNRFQISYVNERYSPSKGDATSTNGVGVKWLHGFHLTQERPLYLQSGLDLHAGFWSEKNYGLKSSLTTINVAVPVNVAYQFPIGEAFTIEPFVGLNLKVNVVAKAKNWGGAGFDISDYLPDDFDDYYDSDYWDDFLDDYFDDEDSKSVNLFDKKKVGKDAQWKRFQLGWHIGANFMYQKKYYLSLQYGTDFMSICKKVNTSTLSVGLGLNF
ncbi:MAG: outer membrane beta-barrel protein [Bacteroides sp.]|nr:outer membrane beta-barrel protein [Bacteroides sp.]